MPKPKADQKPDKERERLRSIQFARPGVVRGEDIWDLSNLRHAHRRASSGKARR
jgi:hypothetical protein